jgi:amidase
MTDDILLSSASEQLDAMATGELSSVELVTMALARIDPLNDELHAVITVNERALEQAEEADRTRTLDNPAGALLGLPVGVKDAFDTSGLATSCGVASLAGNIADSDATAVARLKAAGAIVIAKTNLPPFAMNVQTSSEIGGTVLNPWDRQRSSGGSSGGSAVALATGMTSLELASDLAGSIRIPAHATGVCGHRPSAGLVPLQGYRISPRPVRSDQDMTVAGPMARSVQDLWIALDVLMGPSRQSEVAWSLQLPPPRRSKLRDLRVGVWSSDASAPIDEEVATVLADALGELRSAGARVDEAARPDVGMEESHDTYLRLMNAALGLGMSERAFDDLLERAQGPPDRHITGYARRVTLRHHEWLALNERREAIRAAWDDFFMDHDVLVAPVAPTAAIRHDPGAGPVTLGDVRIDYWDQVRWAGLASLAYLPATVIPAGATRRGLPVGMQIIGPHLQDNTVLAAAAAFSDVLGGFVPPPAKRP